MENNNTIIVMKITQPLQISWQPKEDITTFEMAQCLPYLFRINYGYGIMPNEMTTDEIVLRHFKVIDPNNPTQ